MPVSEQARLATVEEHVRGENARDMDAVMATISESDQASVVYNGIATKGRVKIRRGDENGWVGFHSRYRPRFVVRVFG
jgi:hypothetical protein